MMKYLASLFFILALSACGGSSDDPPPTTPTEPPKENNAPTVPSLVLPADVEKCTDNPLEFSWNKSTDPDGDGVSYNIQLATNNSFSEDLQSGATSNLNTTFTLIKGKAYYWRVNAKDSKNKSSAYSATRKFYSEGEGVSNHLPFAASLTSPALNSKLTDITTTLNWSATDLDNDPLKFDVYFGVANPPVLVVEDISESSFQVDLASDMTYYWKIVIKDDAGGVTIGQVWSFTTE